MSNGEEIKRLGKSLDLCIEDGSGINETEIKALSKELEKERGEDKPCDFSEAIAVGDYKRAIELLPGTLPNTESAIYEGIIKQYTYAVEFLMPYATGKKCSEELDLILKINSLGEPTYDELKDATVGYSIQGLLISLKPLVRQGIAQKGERDVIKDEQDSVAGTILLTPKYKGIMDLIIKR